MRNKQAELIHYGYLLIAIIVFIIFGLLAWKALVIIWNMIF